MPVSYRSTFLVAALASAVPLLAHADEGMWTFDNVPIEAIKARYGTTVTNEWLENVRLSTVRITGCTGTFVSEKGLVLTNHHCVTSCLNELSSPTSNLLQKGFLATGNSEEKRCSRQLADILVAMENVTDRVASATKDLKDQQANEARKKALTDLEAKCEADSRSAGAPLKCESVTLYNGGRYFIYKYKRYTDVRLVFAPEAGIAAFGGDPDNFQFPRWCLDMSMLRVYENGQPLKAPNFLRINVGGASPGELVFVSGHPGSTERLITVNQLLERRGNLPATLIRSSELRGRYIQYGKTGAEQSRLVDERLQSLENGIKVRRKQLDALLDERLLAQKSKEESALRATTMKNKTLAAKAATAWDDIARANHARASIESLFNQLEGGAAFQSTLFNHARTLVRGSAERAKPNLDRLPEYADARIPRIQQQLQAPAPIYTEMEKLTLSFSLEKMRELLGPDHKLVRQLLANESPASLAAKLIDGTSLADPAVRMKLWQDQAALTASADPMIQLARSVDDEARSIRKQFENQVEAPIRIATERIAAARFAAIGTKNYPDATFTLRLNFGTVKGWKEGAEDVAPYTYLARLYDRATGAEPFRIPDSWLAAKDKLDPATPFNLSTTNDIVGGNSGSALINARGEIVGLLFDGNIHSISGAYWYDTELNRAVGVHPAIMRAALTKVYSARGLAEELGMSE